MHYEVIPPCDELKGYISHYWVATWNGESSVSRNTYYVVASNLPEMVFAFPDHHPRSGTVFSFFQGQTYLPRQYPVERFGHLIGISFYSHALPYLFRIPASELTSEFTALTGILGPEGNLLNEQISAVPSTAQRIELISNFLLSTLKEPRKEDHLVKNAVLCIKQHRGNISIGELARESHLSHKQFRRRFKETMGLTPKMYARISRFESVIQDHPAASSFTEAAYSAGYFDQAHFNREFQAFTGFRPKDFWQLSNENH